MLPIAPVLDGTITERVNPILPIHKAQQRHYSLRRRRVAPRLVARSLQETPPVALASLPESCCDRTYHDIDFSCLENGRVVCATQDGAHVLRHDEAILRRRSDKTTSTERQQEPLQWDFVRCPINHYGDRHVHPLVKGSGFMVGLGSGDYYHVGVDGRVASIAAGFKRPRRRYNVSKHAHIASLATQWNRTSPMNKLVELHNWRQGPDLVVSDWDFFETGSSVHALQAGRDYLGLHDYRIGNPKGKMGQDKYQICFYRGGNDTSLNETFAKCCLLSEHIVATTSTTLEEPVRLWDLRQTKGSTGSLLSFPLEKSAAPLQPWSQHDLAQHFGSTATTTGFPRVEKLQRLDEGGNILITCQQSEHDQILDPYTLHLVVDPMEETVKCLSSHKQAPGMHPSSCLVSLTTDHPSLLACASSWTDSIELIDIYGTSSSTTPSNSKTKRRKTSSELGFAKMGNVVGTLPTSDVRDEYGLSSQLLRIAWDARNYRLVGLSQDFDLFEWKL